MINLNYKGDQDFNPNYEKKNFRYEGTIESKKYNDFFNEVSVNNEYIHDLIKENRNKLNNQLLDLVIKNKNLKMKLKYLINKFDVLSELKKKGEI